MPAPQPGQHSDPRLRFWLHRLLPVLGAVLFMVAAWAIYHQLKKHKVQDILDAFDSLSASSVFWAITFTVLGYLTLTGYDYLAMLYVRHRLRYDRVAFAAFIGYAFSNSIGHSFLTGGTVRYRLYSVWGVRGLDIAKVIAFGHVAFYLGMMLLIGQGCILEPLAMSDAVSLLFDVPPIAVQAVGLVMLLIVIGYFVWTNWREAPLRISILHFHMPSFGLSLAQLVIATLDMAMMGAVLWVLLPEHVGMSFAGFLCLFMTAQVIGVASQVPGGLGVFETIILHVFTPAIGAPNVLAALVAYRVVYFIIPLIVAASMLGVYELRTHQHLLFGSRADKRFEPPPTRGI
jgi:uncharacterized membrane protein YbhN (UPF0104 family)